MFQAIFHTSFIQKRPNLVEFIKFAIVGVLGTIVDFGVYSLLTRVFGLYYITATAVSVCAAIINNFFWNKYWTFDKGGSGETRAESWKFFVVSLFNYGFNIGITYAIVEYTNAEQWFGAEEDFFAKIVAIAIVLFSNYFANKHWTFKKE